MFGLNPTELKTLKRLKTPIKIQDFLDTLARNLEKKGETYWSPRRVLKERKAHCIEGALLACLALWLNGEEPLILDLQTKGDVDHVVALYQRNGYWGAISKSNHVALRFRDPVHKTIRELALSYFHEYINNDTKKKTLRAYSARPFQIKKLGTDWITTDQDLQWIAQAIDDAPHTSIMPKKNEKFLRKADNMELRAGTLTEWKKKDQRT